jgi:hypothetical protein
MRKEEEKAASGKQRRTSKDGQTVVLRHPAAGVDPATNASRRSSLMMKSYVDKLDAYQHLLYHLQTNPVYLTRCVCLWVHRRQLVQIICCLRFGRNRQIRRLRAITTVQLRCTTSRRILAVTITRERIRCRATLAKDRSDEYGCHVSAKNHDEVVSVSELMAPIC